MIDDTKLPIIKSPVTYLEMTENPEQKDELLEGYTLQLIENPDAKTYLELYREIGRNYIWNYRPGQTLDEIQIIICAPTTKIYFLFKNENAIGLAECEQKNDASIEIVHFGLLPDYIDKGIGKKFFQNIVNKLWKNGAKRIFLSTCGMDHHKAINFYKSAGFKIFKTEDHEFKDYRFSGFYNMCDAPQIPLAT